MPPATRAASWRGRPWGGNGGFCAGLLLAAFRAAHAEGPWDRRALAAHLAEQPEQRRIAEALHARHGHAQDLARLLRSAERRQA